MSKLPNADKAVVPFEKFTEYALNPEHPTGRHKARVFKAALGLTLDDAEFLQKTVQSAAVSYEAVVEEPTSYGERYVIDFELTTDKGTAKIRSAWMVRKDEDFPRLTSCYVIEE
jgi:hemerythrin-like domain-containing protein